MTTLEGVNPQMIANRSAEGRSQGENLNPFQPTHPGEMQNGKRALSPTLAMMMEAALGIDAAPLLAMQNEYDILMAERNDSFMEKLKQIRRIAAIF